MTSVDPCIPPILLPADSRALIVAEKQEEYESLPSIVTPAGQVITRWELTDEERKAIFLGTDVYVTLLSAGRISPFRISVGTLDWKELEGKPHAK
jgi:hypothetical protein